MFITAGISVYIRIVVVLESLGSKYFNRFDSYDDIVKFWKMCFESAFFHRIFHFWTTLSNILDQVSPIPYNYSYNLHDNGARTVYVCIY